MKQLYHEDYTVGWICALPLERAAAVAMLDESHRGLSQPSTDHNAYTLGAIHGHNIVIASLTAGVYGISSATAVVTQMKTTFPGIEYGLMVGIGGGAPGGSTDVRLGDVVVSRPTGSSSGIIQYDFGKIVGDGIFEHTGSLNKPPSFLLNVIGKIESEYQMGARRIPAILESALQVNPDMRSYFRRSEALKDELFEAEYEHGGGETCDHCDRGRLTTRQPRPSCEPYVHYGLIASANSLMKHGISRDRLRKEKNILCFEMEAAGLMDHIPCVVIRGICDYSDTHKNKTWQHYSAGTAAAYAKELLASVPMPAPMHAAKTGHAARAAEQECLRKLFQVDPYEHKNALKRRKGDRARGTCEWIIDKVQFQTWLGVPEPEEQGKQKDDGDPNPNILWLHCAPATGKSTLAITLADELPKRPSFYLAGKTLIYFFCEAGSSHHRTASAVLRGLLYQLVQQHPRLLTQVTEKYKERDNIFSSFDSLWRILVELCQDGTTGDKFLIIDGLDELEDSSQEDLLRQINQTFSSFDESLSKIHLLIISRPYLNIREELEIFPNTRLSSFDESQQDIKKFIGEQVSKLQARKRYTKKTCDKVSEILNRKAEGTFVWVSLACKELMRVPQRDALATLRKLPSELHTLFSITLGRDFQTAQSPGRLKRILALVVIAERPFSTTELAIACGFDEEEELEERTAFTREDVASCVMLTVGKMEHVTFIHKTAREFLLDSRNSDVCFVEAKAAHALLAYRVIDYMIESPRRLYLIRTDGFYLYCAEYWFVHVREAENLFRIPDEHREFFDDESPVREFSLICFNRLLPPRIPGRPRKTSIFHDIARMNIHNLGKCLLPEGSIYRDDHFTALDGSTPLETAIRYGAIDIFRLFLSRDCEAKPYERVILEAARCETHGNDLIDLLLAHYGPRVQVTTELLIASAENHRFGKENIQSLLQYARGLSISDKVLRAAAGNGECGDAVANILLNHSTDELAISEGTLLTATMNTKVGVNLIKLFLNWPKLEVQNWQGIMREAAGNRTEGQAIMELLLKNAKVPFTVTMDAFVAFLETGESLATLELLLSYLPDSSTLFNEEVWCAAIRNRKHGCDFVQSLLQKTAGAVPMSINIWHSLAFNSVKADEMLKMLSARAEGKLSISEDMLVVGTENKLLIYSVVNDWLRTHPYPSVETWKFILQNCDDVIVGKFGRWYGWKHLQTEDMLLAVARNSYPGCLEEFLKHFEITEELLAVLVKDGTCNLGLKLLKSLLHKLTGPLEEGTVIHLIQRYASSLELFKDIHGKFTITESILMAAASQQLGQGLIEYFYEQEGSSAITFKVICAAFRYVDGSKQFFQRILSMNQPPLSCTAALAEAAAQNRHSASPLEVIFSKFKSNVPITEELVVLAAGAYNNAEFILEILIDNCPSALPVSELAFMAPLQALERYDVLQLLFQDGSSSAFLAKSLRERILDIEAYGIESSWLSRCSYQELVVVAKAVLHEGYILSQETREIQSNTLLHLLQIKHRDLSPLLTHDFMELLVQKGEFVALEYIRDQTETEVANDLILRARLWRAIIEDDYREVVVLMSEHVFPDSSNGFGMTPLCQAIENKCRRTVEALLNTGIVNVNTVVASSGHTPLTLAVQHPPLFDFDPTILTLLLQKGAVSNRACGARYSAYTIARQPTRFGINGAFKKRKQVLVMSLLERYGQDEEWDAPSYDEWRTWNCRSAPTLDPQAMD